MNRQRQQRWLGGAWVALAWLWCALAQAGVPEPVQITLTPEVQAVLQQIEPEQKKHLERAIRVGNLFIRQHFDGSAYAFDQGYVKWSKHTGHLLSMPRQEFEEGYYRASDYLENGQSGLQFLTVCPQLDLSAIRLQGNIITLSYLAIVIGEEVTLLNGREMSFSDSKNGGQYFVFITIGTDYRIGPINHGDTIGRDYRNTRQRLVQADVSQNRFSVDKTKYSQMLRALDRAAEICPAISTNSNTTPKEN